MEISQSTLYIVGTPIGNLSDITLRALDTLKGVDVVACEDTRHTMGLLTHYGIKKPLVSYYKPKEREGAERIISLLGQGKSVALVTDAGMPCISDPGAILVDMVRKEGFEVTAIPGATAVATAIAVSGICAPGFVFVGFLPPKKRDAVAKLKEVDGAGVTIALYCSPHSINDDLALIYDTLGTREVTLVRELTKIYEEVEKVTLPHELQSPRGEYVVLIEAGVKDIKPTGTLEEQVEACIAQGMDKKAAIKKVAKDNGLHKDAVYSLFNKEN